MPFDPSRREVPVRERPTSLAPLVWSGIIVCSVFVLLVSSTWKDYQNTPDPSTVSSAEAGPRYTAQQRQAAQDAMDLVRSGMATMDVEGPHLVVDFLVSGYPADDASRLGLIRSIADADAVLRNGSLRNIYFYDPSGHQMGQADPLNGVRLKH